MAGDEKVLIANLQSARDRMMKALPPLVGDAFDGDFDTMLEAINMLKKIATPPESAQPVGEVDEAMVERARGAWFAEPRTGNLDVAIRRMLTAARLPAQGGGDAEDTVVARLDAAFKDGYAKGYAASSAEDKVPDCEDCAHNGRYLCDEHGPPAPPYCEIHQHYKWCDHNGGVLGKTGYEAPAAAEPSANAGRDGAQQLARDIAAAVASDEQGDGCDISAGMFGPAMSALIRRLTQSGSEDAMVRIGDLPAPIRDAAPWPGHYAGGWNDCLRCIPGYPQDTIPDVAVNKEKQ